MSKLSHIIGLSFSDSALNARAAITFLGFGAATGKYVASVTAAQCTNEIS